tara:strand:- start:1725 stop:2816 length:1092 start_codon:yes stop_codon:yes gene_type:complete
MAESFYKTLDGATDIVDTRTLLHEAIPLTGTIVSGTYSDENIKNYAHGMFQSVYDYPFLSSSANHVFDITVGVSTKGLTVTNQASKKRNIYNQMAQMLMGYDATGSILRFDQDGNIAGGGAKLDNVFFLNFSRLLVKDEIKKGSFQIDFGVKDEFTSDKFTHRLKLQDTSGSDGFLVNSPAGEYGILFATGSTTTNNVMHLGTPQPVGLLFYQAGIAVISGSIFNDAAIGGILNNSSPIETTQMGTNFGPTGFNHVTASTIQATADAIRARIYNIQFNNTVELNSTIYFCRMNHNEFNYSTNPTYLSGSKIRVKTKTSDVPISYITTIGLYNDNNELMAVAKLSEPLRKDPSQEYTIRARLDY